MLFKTQMPLFGLFAIGLFFWLIYLSLPTLEISVQAQHAQQQCGITNVASVWRGGFRCK